MIFILKSSYLFFAKGFLIIQGDACVNRPGDLGGNRGTALAEGAALFAQLCRTISYQHQASFLLAVCVRGICTEDQGGLWPLQVFLMVIPKELYHGPVAGAAGAAIHHLGVGKIQMQIML